VDQFTAMAAATALHDPQTAEVLAGLLALDGPRTDRAGRLRAVLGGR
jgi:hypothetical protein